MLFQIRLILPLTAVLASLLCVGTAESCCAAEDTGASYAGKSAAEWIQVLDSRIEKETDEDKDACRQAAAALGQIGPAAKDAVPLLTKALQSPSLEFRHFAVDALGRIGSDARESIPAIVVEMDIPKDHDNYAALTRFRRYAAKALGGIGVADQEAVRVLEEALENEDRLYCVEAALALWKMNGDAKAIPALESIIEKDEAEGPFEAIMALRQIGPEAKSVTDTLVATLKHDNADLRRAAAKVLAQFGPTVLRLVGPLLSDNKLAAPEEVAYVLGELLAEIRNSMFYDQQLSEAEFVKVREFVFDLVQPALVPLLSHERDEVRAVASRSLAQMGILAVPLLLPILDGDDQQARQCVIDTLIRLEPFLPGESPASDGVEQVKRELVAPLMGLMGHTMLEVRRAAYRAFAEFSFGAGGTAAMPLLLKALRDPDAAIRRYATKARD